jgi:hypothetical protein
MAYAIQIETAILFRLAGGVKLTQPKWLKMCTEELRCFLKFSQLDDEADTEFLAVERA